MKKGNEQIVVEYALAEPPAKVWRALTEPKLLAVWLMQNDIVPIVGHRFNFRAQPVGDWNGVVDCEVLEVVPERKLVYTWNGGSDKNLEFGHRIETTVTWTLEATTENGTRLTLVHHGFHPEDFAFRMMGQGWKTKGADIERALATMA
ncbi:MAG TPA: SRPBCC domain-containing protein [Acidobacteriaceae bacterium]|jgi:uncharacterized protein YndB with AHSA1/START domain|nr:SRPBCC domain-containing protein [Acidobacteriaceae bacterium]